LLDLDGDYYRLLIDGSYAIKVESPGYESQTKYVTVHNEPKQDNAQRLDFILQPISNKQVGLRQMLKELFKIVRKCFVFHYV
jgi:hypothetical protein